MTLIHPGETSETEFLTDLLKSIHNDRRDSILASIQRRRDAGAPLDDDTRWPLVTDLMKSVEGALARRETSELRKGLLQILDATGSFLDDPGDYVPSERLYGVQVRLRVLPARVWRHLSNAEHRALEKQAAAMKRLLDDAENEALQIAAEDAGEAVIASRCTVVAAVLAGLVVDGQEVTCDDAVAEVLDRSGLLYSVYTACVAWQELPWGKGARSGSPRRAT